MKTYIFGSGASTCIGLPITKNLIDVVKKERFFGNKLLNYPRTPEEFNLYEKHFPLSYQYFTNYTEFEKSFKKYEEEKKNENIEEYLQWFKKKNNKIDDDLMRIVYWYFWDRHNNLKVSRYHQIFIREIFKRDEGLISFNYDLMLEKAFKEKNYDAIDKQNDLRINPSYVTVSKYDYWPIILKPMGSANWIYGLQPKTPITFYDHNTGRILVTSTQNIFLKLNENPYICTTPMYFEFDWNKLDNILPCMKWAGAFEYTKGFFKTIWEKCNETLLKSDEIISFGYAFPESDENELNVILKGCKSKKVKLVCGKDNNYKDICDELKKYKIEGIPIRKTFEDWIFDEVRNKEL